VNRFHRYYCASPGWAHLVQMTLVPAVLEGTEQCRRVLEIGPDPGLTTEVLARVAPELTAIEIDPTLARATRDRVPTAQVVEGDAATMPFADATFSAVVCLTMLHHLPYPELQDRLFVEVHRMLRLGRRVLRLRQPRSGPQAPPHPHRRQQDRRRSRHHRGTTARRGVRTDTNPPDPGSCSTPPPSLAELDLADAPA
jgi:hypothetical protein